ncbi:MAG TPA: DUF1501 domain-containing protein [Chthoniobacteraceae bacterium]|jgi:hypothetical protein|nr:DUF1501 domain-containing protein [Chthoniobacteraceae bacterium]
MSSCTDYQVSRRRFLSQFVGTAAMLGMPINRLVAEIGAAHAPKAESVILFWNGGGMSHLDTWDPKTGREVSGEFEAIKTSADGIQISEIFPQLAKQMHHCSLIRSIAGTNGDHGRATYELQTSYPQNPAIVHPGLGSFIVNESNRTGDLPSYISIGGMAPRAGYLGQRCEAYYIGLPGERDPYLAFPDGISQVQGQRRLEVLARMNARASQKVANKDLKETEVALKDAVNLMKSPALATFDLDKENPKTLERYGSTEFGRGALLAKKLVETGVRFVQVNRGGFDLHTDVFPAMRNHGSVMDPALASLIEDLSASGRLEKTLVIVLSEFGRTPKINMNAGRDHHAKVFSCLLAGGGVKGGQVIGSSDADGMEPKDRPVQVPDLHASVCHALGIDHTKELTTPTGRPMKLVKEGAKPVAELFA